MQLVHGPVLARADQPVGVFPRLLLALLAAVHLVTARASHPLSDGPVLLHRLAQHCVLELLRGEDLLGTDEALGTVGAARELLGGQGLGQQHGLVAENHVAFLHRFLGADGPALGREGHLHGHVLG